MLYPPKAQNAVGDAPNLRTSPFHDDHFQAIVVIHVNVRGSQHFILGLVLRLDQTLQKLRAVVVVDHGQGPTTVRSSSTGNGSNAGSDWLCKLS